MPLGRWTVGALGRWAVGAAVGHGMVRGVDHLAPCWAWTPCWAHGT